ncbi:MAG: alpha/beta hydrolase [Clostridia bacterium]|nr:alpha/beta hydrolase [Clostridia bacterium]
MMNKKSFTAHDGKEIFYREWLPGGEPKGILQISHGMSEATSRYAPFAEFISSKGYIVIGDDHRGHGDTDTDRTGYCEGDMFNDTLKDIDRLGSIYKEKYGLPVVIFGHSYGSFLTQRYIEVYGENVDGAILGGSAYMRDITVPSARVVSSLNCALGKKEKDAKLLKKASFDLYNKNFKEGTFISSIVAECERYNADPDCNFDLSNAFYKSFFGGVAQLYKKKNYKNIDVDKPILIISGKDDPVGKYGRSVLSLEKFYREKVGVKDVTVKLYDGVRHEYLNDISRQDAYDTMLAFLDRVIVK